MQSVNSGAGYNRAVPCTLFSGNYHFGAGALANSLYRNGFRGTMYVGYVPPLPPWCRGCKQDGEDVIFDAADDFTLRFIAWPSEQNLSLQKARFLLHVLDAAAPDAAAALFFDSDVAVHGSWQFFEEWVGCGMALCLDVCYPLVPSGHPWRHGWRALALEAGYGATRDLEYYVNSGFVGVPRSERATIECWSKLIDAFLRRHPKTLDVVKFAAREQAFVGDQDMLNAALMATNAQLSIMGQEGMDFRPAGFTMSHAVDGAKPWQKHFIAQALAGRPPAMADKVFWRYADGPISLFSRRRIALTRLTIKAAAAIGRLYRRS